ncbi:MAG: hypothetical protein IJS32_04705 [Kiritimatiellae bacterium]|nr:hypothetical protein [Kiritimatiellia bacterium]
MLLPDPITHADRLRSRERYERRNLYILFHRPGFNLRYWKRILRMPERVDRMAETMGWSDTTRLFVKARLLSRMTCFFVDHLVGRLREAGLTCEADLAHEWERQYAHFLDLFLRLGATPDAADILWAMKAMTRLTQPPRPLLRCRERHWRLVSRVADGGARVAQVMASPRSPKAKASRICFLAAREADRFEKTGVRWEDGYGRSMLANYADFRADEDVYLAVVEYEDAAKSPQ